MGLDFNSRLSKTSKRIVVTSLPWYSPFKVKLGFRCGIDFVITLHIKQGIEESAAALEKNIVD